MRPASIVQFERLFLGAFAVRLVGDAIGFGASLKAVKANALTAAYGSGAILAILAITYVAALVLWYFAAKRASVVAKWLISIWFIVATCMTALALFRGALGFDLRSAISLAGFLLFGWAVSYLFKPDADTWFAKPSA